MVYLKIYREYGHFHWKGKDEGKPPGHPQNMKIRAYKTSEFLFIIHIVMGIFLVMFLFVILCAFNNTFWKLPYLTV